MAYNMNRRVKVP